VAVRFANLLNDTESSLNALEGTAEEQLEQLWARHRENLASLGQHQQRMLGPGAAPAPQAVRAAAFSPPAVVAAAAHSAAGVPVGAPPPLAAAAATHDIGPASAVAFLGCAGGGGGGGHFGLAPAPVAGMPQLGGALLPGPLGPAVVAAALDRSPAAAAAAASPATQVTWSLPPASTAPPVAPVDAVLAGLGGHPPPSLAACLAERGGGQGFGDGALVAGAVHQDDFSRL